MEYCKNCQKQRQCCPRCHCCQCCCRCCPCPAPTPGAFQVTKRALPGGAALAGAEYTLYRDGAPVLNAVSDASGALAFMGLAPGNYELVETAPPAGYAADPVRHQVTVGADGSVTVDGRPAAAVSLFDTPAAALAFSKTDTVTGAPVAGAAFTLSNGASAVSDANGRVDFGTLSPGAYTMTETKAPEGYEQDPVAHTVVVAQDGSVTVDGVPADRFTARNQPVESLAFRKSDQETGAPLSGAVFTLSDGRTAVSNENGLVDFGTLAPGTYTMTETTAPAGYRTDDASHTVVVAADGSVTVDGLPVSEFGVLNIAAHSEKPVILSVVEGDRTVTGLGTPGAAVNVTFPDGSQAAATVDNTGHWSVEVPANVTLRANDTLYASQTVPGYGASENASFLVQPRG